MSCLYSASFHRPSGALLLALVAGSAWAGVTVTLNQPAGPLASLETFEFQAQVTGSGDDPGVQWSVFVRASPGPWRLAGPQDQVWLEQLPGGRARFRAGADWPRTLRVEARSSAAPEALAVVDVLVRPVKTVRKGLARPRSGPVPAAQRIAFPLAFAGDEPGQELVPLAAAWDPGTAPGSLVVLDGSTFHGPRLVRLHLDGRRAVLAGPDQLKPTWVPGPRGTPRPGGLAVRPDGGVVLADPARDRILLVKDGAVTVLAGAGQDGATGDLGSDGRPLEALRVRLAQPLGLAAAADGSVVFAEAAAHRIRRITPEGFLHTLAGPEGTPCFDAKGQLFKSQGPGPARPTGVGLAPDGRVLFIDSRGLALRALEPSGGLATLAGLAVQTTDLEGPGDPVAAWPEDPAPLAVTPDGAALHWQPGGSGALRLCTPAKDLVTVAGGPMATLDPDAGGQGSADSLSLSGAPCGLAALPGGGFLAILPGGWTWYVGPGPQDQPAALTVAQAVRAWRDGRREEAEALLAPLRQASRGESKDSAAGPVLGAWAALEAFRVQTSAALPGDGRVPEGKRSDGDTRLGAASGTAVSSLGPASADSKAEAPQSFTFGLAADTATTPGWKPEEAAFSFGDPGGFSFAGAPQVETKRESVPFSLSSPGDAGSFEPGAFDFGARPKLLADAAPTRLVWSLTRLKDCPQFHGFGIDRSGALPDLVCLGSANSYRVALDGTVQDLGSHDMGEGTLDEQLAQDDHWSLLAAPGGGILAGNRRTGIVTRIERGTATLVAGRFGAGTLEVTGPDGRLPRAVDADLSPLEAMVAAPDGRILVAQAGANLIRAIGRDGTLTTVLRPEDALDFPPPPVQELAPVLTGLDLRPDGRPVCTYVRVVRDGRFFNVLVEQDERGLCRALGEVPANSLPAGHSKARWDLCSPSARPNGGVVFVDGGRGRVCLLPARSGVETLAERDPELTVTDRAYMFPADACFGDPQAAAWVPGGAVFLDSLGRLRYIGPGRGEPDLADLVERAVGAVRKKRPQEAERIRAALRRRIALLPQRPGERIRLDEVLDLFATPLARRGAEAIFLHSGRKTPALPRPVMRHILGFLAGEEDVQRQALQAMVALTAIENRLDGVLGSNGQRADQDETPGTLFE